MKYKFKTKPYAHQLKALEMSWNRETYAYFMEMGTGKTKVLIDNMAMLYDHGKIDDLVHIAHNVKIKKFSQITAGVIGCGRATVGEGCWIAPNAVIDGGCEIGNNCFVGTSSLVRKNFPDNCMLIGSPAKILRKMEKS